MFPQIDAKGIVRDLIIFGIVCLAVALLIGFGIGRATAAELTGSRVLTIERSDAGELYAALSIALEAALADHWALVLVYDQAAEWAPGFEEIIDRRTEWDVALAWRPWDGWSISAGRRWRVGPPPDYGGWTYVQVWR